MPGGPGADPSKRPTPGPLAAHRRQPHRHGQRHLARHCRIAEAASTDDFQRLNGTTNMRIPDLSQPQPRLTAEIDLDKSDGSTAELRWSDVSLTNSSFSQGSAGDHHIHGRFHGQDHAEAWGIFTPTPTWAHSALCGNHNGSRNPPIHGAATRRPHKTAGAASAGRRLSGGSFASTRLALLSCKKASRKTRKPQKQFGRMFPEENYCSLVTSLCKRVWPSGLLASQCPDILNRPRHVFLLHGAASPKLPGHAHWQQLWPCCVATAQFKDYTPLCDSASMQVLQRCWYP